MLNHGIYEIQKHVEVYRNFSASQDCITHTQHGRWQRRMPMHVHWSIVLSTW